MLSPWYLPLSFSVFHQLTFPENILVSSPRPKWHVKLADFGIAKKTDGTFLETHYIGSPGYMAPELYGDPSRHYTAAVDVWALGAVAFCLRTCSPPFRTIKHLLDYAHDHRVQFPIRPLGTSSSFCMNFVLGTMADLPERRLIIEHVLAHEWLSQNSTASEGWVGTLFPISIWAVVLIFEELTQACPPRRSPQCGVYPHQTPGLIHTTTPESNLRDPFRLPYR